MAFRSIILFVILGFFTNGCLYSCNYPKKDKMFANTDPCNDSGKSEFLQFTEMTGGKGTMNLSLLFRLPCEGGHPYNFSLGFYKEGHVLSPSTDLTNVNVKNWGFGKGASCQHPERNQATIDNIINKQIDFVALSEGIAITFGVGKNHPSRLYPYFVKIPYTNEGAIGTPHTSPKEEACTQGANMDPFLPDPNTLSPVFQKGLAITSIPNEIFLSLYSDQLVPLVAPFYTYGTKFANENSEQGLKSMPGGSSQGSLFTFQIHMKPGKYYIVLGGVKDPMGAALGHFSLSSPKVYGGTEQSLDYSLECSKDVLCQGRAKPVQIS